MLFCQVSYTGTHCVPVPLFSVVQSNQFVSLAPTLIINNSYSHNIFKYIIVIDLFLNTPEVRTI